MKTKECHETEPNPSKDRAMPEGDNPLFRDEFTKFTHAVHVFETLSCHQWHRGFTAKKPYVMRRVFM
jgi:hypothetical protein